MLTGVWPVTHFYCYQKEALKTQRAFPCNSNPETVASQRTVCPSSSPFLQWRFLTVLLRWPSDEVTSCEFVAAESHPARLVKNQPFWNQTWNPNHLESSGQDSESNLWLCPTIPLDEFTLHCLGWIFKANHELAQHCHLWEHRSDQEETVLSI